MSDIERIKNDILKQVLLHFDDFSQCYIEYDNCNYYSPSDVVIKLSPSDYSLLKEALYGR